jgi:hypothetical protein
MRDNRLFFSAGTNDSDVQAVARAGRDTLSICCNSDWCGDSTRGFGATVSVDISRADAARLRDFLNAWLDGL